MKNLKTELANLLNIIVGKTSLLEMSTDDFYPVLAQAIIDSGLMVDRESVKELVEAATEFFETEVWVSGDCKDGLDKLEVAENKVRQALSKFQSKGDVK